MRLIITSFATILLISGCSLTPPAPPDMIPVPILAQLQQSSHVGGVEPLVRTKSVNHGTEPLGGASSANGSILVSFKVPEDEVSPANLSIPLVNVQASEELKRGTPTTVTADLGDSAPLEPQSMSDTEVGNKPHRLKPGQKIHIQINRDKGGYLYIFDANGERLYPNPQSEENPNENPTQLIEQAVTLPNVYSGFEWIAPSKLGPGGVLVLLAENHLPENLLGQIEALLPEAFKQVSSLDSKIVSEPLSQALTQILQQNQTITDSINGFLAAMRYEIRDDEEIISSDS